MTRRQHRPAIWVFISGMVGIILFLLLLAVLRYFATYFASALLAGFAEFLTLNAGLIIFLGIMFMIADIFHSFSLPFNLPGPIFSAIGSVFLIEFLFRLLEFVDGMYGVGTFPSLHFIEFLLYPIVFFIVLVAGYWSILSPDVEKERPVMEPASGPEKGSPAIKSWEDIGNEFREMMYDIFHRIREEIRRK
jgi:hypothetical protein